MTQAEFNTICSPSRFKDWLKMLPETSSCGMRKVSCACPVAKFLVSQKLNSVSAGQDEISCGNSERISSERISFKTPKWASLFIEKTDSLGLTGDNVYPSEALLILSHPLFGEV